jgi:hypothetical protein
MFLDVPPIPVDATAAARQAVVIERLIADAGGIPAATTAAVDVIVTASPTDPPTELNRLRLLYRYAYTRQELERLVVNNFVDLGLAPRV